MTPRAAGDPVTAPAGARDAYARLVLETMPEESRVGLTLGFVRTFAVPGIAAVLHGTGRMTGAPKARGKATGAAIFALIGHGPDSPQGRRVVAELRRVHDRPGITPELMHYVLACFTVCPLRFVDAHGPRPVTAAEREAAYAFHRQLADALGLPGTPGPTAAADAAGTPGLPALEAWMAEFERRSFAPSEAGRALWQATGGLLASRLPGPLARLAPAVAASLLDEPLRTAFGVRRPPAPVRALVGGALRLRARGRRRAALR
ncbi:oxygenase MpaB family protein [Kitasatospora sp. NPDC088346]|uniref:oxygenase MpaB family protein n=1 Tax=Kitasatospora sp. NPDC088346 TaxID=3364073 RepID=UPI003811806C